MSKADTDLPVPELEPRPIPFAQYQAFTPEKLELLSGYLIAPLDSPESAGNFWPCCLSTSGWSRQ